jgi:dTDP-4-dehydrorhamnose reductase
VRLLVTGGRTGYLGRHVVTAAAAHEVVAVGSADADIRDRAAVDELVGRHRPDAVVHTAYVQSDWDVTATGAAHVALAAQRYDARLVLLSSDVVFSGDDVS